MKTIHVVLSPANKLMLREKLRTRSQTPIKLVVKAKAIRECKQAVPIPVSNSCYERIQKRNRKKYVLVISKKYTGGFLSGIVSGLSGLIKPVMGWINNNPKIVEGAANAIGTLLKPSPAPAPPAPAAPAPGPVYGESQQPARHSRSPPSPPHLRRRGRWRYEYDDESDDYEQRGGSIHIKHPGNVQRKVKNDYIDKRTAFAEALKNWRQKANLSEIDRLRLNMNPMIFLKEKDYKKQAVERAMLNVLQQNLQYLKN